MEIKMGNVLFTEKLFHTGSLMLNYVVGPVRETPLVLIPAQIGMWESYRKVMPQLSEKFEVHAVDIRGHGKSEWTTGNYSWQTVGSDLITFLKEIVKRKAIVSGNSSGGLIALWLAVHVPEYITGIVLEDAPLFSAEMPRFKIRDKFVYQGLKHLVENIGEVKNRNLSEYFRGTIVPIKKGNQWKYRKMPDWFIDILHFFIRHYQKMFPDKPVDIPFFPFTLRILLKSLSMFDPDFARAFVDGRFYDGFDHSETLRKCRCPILLLHATSVRHPELGLIGAMDEADVKHAMELAPGLIYKKVEVNHVIHVFKPAFFVEELEKFSDKVIHKK